MPIERKNKDDFVGRFNKTDFIDRLWDLKLGQRAEEFEREWNFLKKQLSLEQGTMKVESTSSLERQYKVDFVISFLTLNACCLRRSGLISQARQQMHDLKSLEWQMGSKKTGFFYFNELASQAFLLSDDMKAFEISKKALAYAPDSMYSMLPLSTLLLCEENMGIQESTTYEILLKLREQYKNNFVIIGIEQLLQSYHIRFLARRGDIKNLLQISEYSSLKILGHETYTLISLQQIPFLKFPKSFSDEEAINILLDYPIPYFRHYLTGTILGLWKEADSQMLSTADAFDRLYLWAWKWFTKGRPQDLENVMLMINQVVYPENFEKLASMVSVLLRNTLMWMTICDPASEETCRAIARKLNLPQEGFAALWDYEYYIAEYCLHSVQGRESEAQEILQKLKGHSLWNSEYQILADLILLKDLPTDHPLFLIQKTLYYRGNDKDDEHFKIHLEENLIQKGQLSFISRPMARALSLFVGHSSVDLKEFAEFSMDISSYDDLGQRRRVFKLLKTIKEELSPPFSFKILDGRIHLLGDSSLLQIQGELKTLHSLRTHPGWKKFLSNQRLSLEFSLGFPLEFSLPKKQLSTKSLEILKVLSNSKKAWSQKNLSKHLKMKRTTLLRHLKDLKTNGYVLQQGAGPTSKYIMHASPPASY